MGDGMLHIDRLGLLTTTNVSCCVCGKVFAKTKDHVYRVGYNDKDYYSCSWTCHRKKQAEIDEKINQRRKRKNCGVPLKEQPAIDDSPPTLEEEIKKAKLRIAECEKKARQWVESVNRTRPGSHERKKARNNAWAWRMKLDEAKKALEELRKK